MQVLENKNSERILFNLFIIFLFFLKKSTIMHQDNVRSMITLVLENLNLKSCATCFQEIIVDYKFYRIPTLRTMQDWIINSALFVKTDFHFKFWPN